jgi:hypothetical protein
VIRRVSGVVVHCDDCHEEWWEDGAPCWESEAGARAWLQDAGWVFTGFGQALCPVCRSQQGCAESGHEFLPASACRCSGSIPAHQRDGCRDWQLCARCGHTEETDVPNTITKGSENP